MSVNWSWKHKMGEITIRGRKGFKNYKVNLYHANCLCAMIYEYKDKETKEKMYQFYGFFNDEQHAKRCLGIEPTKTYDYEQKKYVTEKENIYKDEWVKVSLNIFYKDMEKFAKLLARAKFDKMKIEIYYKEPKQAKKKA